MAKATTPRRSTTPQTDRTALQIDARARLIARTVFAVLLAPAGGWVALDFLLVLAGPR